MISTTPPLGRGLIVSSAALLIALALSGCGRRGQLEPPEAAMSSPPAQTTVPADPRLRLSRTTAGRAAPSPTTLATSPGTVVEDAPDDDEEGESELIQSVVPTPTASSRKRTRPFGVPNEPFVLDPLL